MVRIAYFDCFSGISGDMTLGALIDLGVPVERIESAVRSMRLPELSITAEQVKKCGFRALHVKITHPPEHAHRHLHHITDMIDRADEVSEAAKDLAKRIFHEVAVAEAKVHGSTMEKVHFHEVGAIDSIADIVGTAVALDHLGVQTIHAAPVPTGNGSITIAHGRVAIPAPATAEILTGIPLAPCEITGELTTPTGAAILKSLATSFGGLPAMKIEAVGYGAGTMDLDGQANVLRVLLGEIESDATTMGPIQSDRIAVLETNLDDSTPEQLADCAERLMAAGALDVIQIPCMMKKGRCGVIVSVITPTTRIALMEQILFQHSSAIGIRRHLADRHKLVRTSVNVETTMGPVRGKVVVVPGLGERFTVEDDDARAVATANQTTGQEVRRLARDAWDDQRKK
ncbi:nickel pincer cofactor biosynthesis protein LarC [Stieleria varia]|nr:nickel pincer cofactor biosynthesis protein LarC [Stieleria varia]